MLEPPFDILTLLMASTRYPRKRAMDLRVGCLARAYTADRRL
jgi:hypothetical protein